MKSTNMSKKLNKAGEITFTNTRRQLWYYAFLVVLALVPIILGTIIGISVSSQAYTKGGLLQPSWAPPGWLFAPAWSFLYLTIGISSALIWHYGGGITAETAAPLFFYFTQLVVNFIWTPVYFGLGYLGGSLIIISILWTLIVAMMATFVRISWIATLLLIPYLAWVSFATALTYATVDLNGCVYQPNNTISP